MSNKFKFDGKEYTIPKHLVNNGETSLMYLLLMNLNINPVKLKKFILKNKEQLNKQDKCGYTAFIHLSNYANRVNLVELIKVFVECGADINLKHCSGCDGIELLCFRLMVNAGANPHFVGHESKNSLELCCKYYSHNRKTLQIKIFEEPIKVLIEYNMRGGFEYTEEDILRCLKFGVCRDILLSYLEALFYRKIGYERVVG